MITLSATRFFLAFFASALGLSPAALAQPAATLRIEAIDHTGTLKADPESVLFIGGGFNGWDPAGTEQDGWLEDDTGLRVGWVFEIERAVIEHGGQFKLTRGDWGTVESTALGLPIENRRTGPLDWSGDGPVLRIEIVGFEDRREQLAEENPGSVVGGKLQVWGFHSEALGEDRTVRVWLPQSYTDHPDLAFGVFYFHDGQNVFDTRSSAFGVEWQADEAFGALTETDRFRPWIVVGVDNASTNRSRDYLPFEAGGEYNSMPSGGADDYITFLIDELMPEINRRYRTETGPANTGLGGSSFGGVITLYAIISRPGVFGHALIESPSLWVGDGRLMKAIETHQGQWPSRVFLAQGDAETGRTDHDERLVRLTREAGEMMRAAGLDEERLRVVIEPGARHNEAAWQKRLPGALEFLIGGGD